jgi:creatinine amidohydrolase/Fe(II)-dependent formamide hydrolase-like protein
MELAEAGFTGELQEAVASMFSGGVASISANGAIGDPTSASRQHGERYWSAVEEIVAEQVEGGS